MSEIATLGGGCFWCTEAVFSDLKGVEKVEPGYSGGSIPNPSYEQVCSDSTGHAEVVQVTFDPGVISFREILRVFFSVPDPTTPARQGNDVVTQYRSVIFFHDEGQRKVAEETMEEINDSKIWGRPIATELAPFKAFYKAEDYHFEYFKKNPYQPYCQVIIAPKVAKFRKHNLEMLKK